MKNLRNVHDEICEHDVVEPRVDSFNILSTSSLLSNLTDRRQRASDFSLSTLSFNRFIIETNGGKRDDRWQNKLIKEANNNRHKTTSCLESTGLGEVEKRRSGEKQQEKMCEEKKPERRMKISEI